MFKYLRERRQARLAAEAAERARWESLTPEQRQEVISAMHASDDWEDMGYFDGR